MSAGWIIAIIAPLCLVAGWFGRWLYDGCLILKYDRESYERGRADERAARQALSDHDTGNTDQLHRETAAPAVLAVPVPSPAPETLAMPDAPGTDLPEQRDWEPGELTAMREAIVAEGGYADFSSRLSAFVSERDRWLEQTRAELAEDRQRLGLDPFAIFGGAGKLFTPAEPGGRHARR